jgi:hypothetical protein
VASKPPAGTAETGFYANDLNQTIPDAVPPAGWSLFTTLISNPQTVNGVAYDYVMSSGNYQLPAGVVLKGKILIRGDATLYVPSDHGSKIVWTPTGKSALSRDFEFTAWRPLGLCRFSICLSPTCSRHDAPGTGARK